MMKKLYFSVFLIVSSVALLFGADFARAYVVEDLHLPNNGNIIVGPGKTELLLSPGDSYTVEVLVSNVSGMTKIIKFGAEDMTASKNPDEALEFLGPKRGPYSLRDYVIPEQYEVTLLTGQRLRMPVTVNIPQTAEPGGLYGALMIEAHNLPEDNKVKTGSAAGQINLITRVASLMFIRVKGDVLEKGSMTGFKAAKGFYEKGPVSMLITSENSGNVYLSPHGTIEIKDIFGRTVDQREVDSWFVMPKSEREREIKWNSPLLFGKYTATLSMARGYEQLADVIDVKSASFWVIPWKIMLAVLVGLVLVIWFFVWIASHLQWKRR